MTDFFISYNGADRAWAEWIAWELEQASYTVLIQAWDFKPGSNFVIDMKKAADECERTIAVLSPNYIGATYTQPEWAAAFVQDPTGEKGLLVPVRVLLCEIPKLLKAVVPIDIVGMTEAEAHDELLNGVKRGRGKPDKKPSFPPAKLSFPLSGTEAPRFPEVWNVPHLRNPNFIGRDNLLSHLHSALVSGELVEVTQAIAGLGGVGKTQLAIEYAYRYVSDYSLVWWVRGDTAVTADADYAKLAQELDLPEKDLADQPKVVAAVREWFEHHANWLLILDHVESPAECDRFRPRSNTGHILITSRNQNWPDAAVLSIRELPRSEAIAFLQKRSGRQDAKAAGDLCDAVGNLPLAIDQAGAYIWSNGITIAEYLSLFHKYSQDLLDPIAVTWRMSFEKLGTENRAAPDLLYLIAYLAPDNIPRDLLQSTAKTPTEFNKAVESLRRYSLIETGDGMVSVHRLVQKVVRDRLIVEGKHKEWAEKAIRLVNDAFPLQCDNYANWPACSRLLAHAVAAADRAEEFGLGDAWRLLNESGIYLTSRAQFEEAEEMFRRALRIAEKVFRADDAKVATIIGNIGRILLYKEDLEGALQYTKRALVIEERVHGHEHPAVATRFNTIGWILKEKGDLEEALRYAKQALSIGEKTLVPDDPQIAAYTNNIGLIFQNMGDLDEALQYAQRALQIDEKAYGPDHPAVAIEVNNIGGILKAKGDLKGALGQFERAVRILQRTYGPDHPQTKIVEGNLGVVKAEIALDNPHTPPPE